MVGIANSNPSLYAGGKFATDRGGKQGADVNAKDNNGETALIEAASTGHTETVQALLDAGADVDAEGVFEMTALMWAKRKDHTEIVELLRKDEARE